MTGTETLLRAGVAERAHRTRGLAVHLGAGSSGQTELLAQRGAAFLPLGEELQTLAHGLGRGGGQGAQLARVLDQVVELAAARVELEHELLAVEDHPALLAEVVGARGEERLDLRVAA